MTDVPNKMATVPVIPSFLVGEEGRSRIELTFPPTLVIYAFNRLLSGNRLAMRIELA